MILKLLLVDFLKIKRKGLWLLCLIAPLGVIALQIVNYGLRKDYLFQNTDDRWQQYISNVHSFTPLTIILGTVILTSFMATIEDETNAWKQLFALPVSKQEVYFSKYTVICFLLIISSIILLLFTYFYGRILDLGKDIPYMLIVQYSLLPFFSSLPVLGLQHWLSTVCKNQAIPITVGIFGVILAFLSMHLPDWVFWKWPTLHNQWDLPYINALLGIFIGMVVYIIGMIDYKRREVK